MEAKKKYLFNVITYLIALSMFVIFFPSGPIRSGALLILIVHFVVYFVGFLSGHKDSILYTISYVLNYLNIVLLFLIYQGTLSADNMGAGFIILLILMPLYGIIAMISIILFIIGILTSKNL